MQLSSILALAATASAAALQKRQSIVQPITDFSADCVPHGSECLFSFAVPSTDAGLPPSHCNASVLLQNSAGLPAVTAGTCPDNVAYTWSFTKAPANATGYSNITLPSSRPKNPATHLNTTTTPGYDFAIWYAFNARSNITYCHPVPARAVVLENNGASSSPHYRGAKNFTAEVGACPSYLTM